MKNLNSKTLKDCSLKSIHQSSSDKLEMKIKAKYCICLRRGIFDVNLFSEMCVYAIQLVKLNIFTLHDSTIPK